MNSEINLIGNRRKSGLQREKIIKRTQLAAFICLGVIAVFSIALFFINKNSSLTAIQQKETAVNDALAQVKNKTVTLLLIKERLNDIDGILKKRSSFENSMTQLTDGMPPTVVTDSLILTKQSITFEVSSSSLSAVNTYLDYLTNKIMKKELFSKLTVDNLIIDSHSQRYVLSLEGDLL